MDSPKELWNLLHQRTCDLFAVWQLYSALYGNQSLVECMNLINGVGFRIIQDCMIHEQIRLSMALTDRAEIGRYQNISIHRLLETLPADSREPIGSKLDSLSPALEKIRTHRNKRLMHFDLGTALDEGAIQNLMAQDLEKAIVGIGLIMSDCAAAVLEGHWAYEHIDLRNAEGAIGWMIRDSLRFKELRQSAQDSSISDIALRAMLLNRTAQQVDRPSNDQAT